MKIEDLKIPADNQKRITKMIGIYKQNGIVIDLVSFSNNRFIVRAEQKDTSDKVLAKAELVKRVRELFAGELPEDWKLTVSAVDFDRGDIDSVNAEWVNTQMERHNLKAKHLCTRTGIDKSTMSLFLAGEREFTKWHKVAFYYLFKYLDATVFDKK